MTQFDEAYRTLLRRIMTEGSAETNSRTGHETRALPGLTIEVDAGFPLLTLRRIPLRVFIAEQVWFLTGSRRPEESLRQFTKIWDDFTNLNGVIPSAYGYRWRHHFNRDQIGELVALLERDPSSRQGVVIAWDPASDGLDARRVRKNVPCPYSFTVNIIGGALHLHNMVRSNDMLLGCPHDVAGFALLQRILAARLGVAVGKYTHSISNAHVYAIHYEAARALIEREHEHAEIELSVGADALARAESGDFGLVEEIEARLNAQYHPLPAIKGLQIVL
ncbi:MAG TPA: thymidylate synthase [Ktedonobacterales bacterium]